MIDNLRLLLLDYLDSVEGYFPVQADVIAASLGLEPTQINQTIRVAVIRGEVLTSEGGIILADHLRGQFCEKIQM